MVKGTLFNINMNLCSNLLMDICEMITNTRRKMLVEKAVEPWVDEIFTNICDEYIRILASCLLKNIPTDIIQGAIESKVRSAVIRTLLKNDIKIQYEKIVVVCDNSLMTKQDIEEDYYLFTAEFAAGPSYYSINFRRK